MDKKKEDLQEKGMLDEATGVTKTHQKKEGVNELKLYWADAFGTSKAKGVAIIVAKRCEFMIKAIKRDDMGRFLIIQGLIYGRVYLSKLVRT
ncbi:Retrovirus-related Pol polyprotein LINE-1, partial [Ophiophagus hannah]